jgi:hypothetical protein
MMRLIEVLSEKNDITPFIQEVLTPQVQSLWQSYGKSFYAFRHTESIRLLGPSEQVGAVTMENVLRNNTEIVDLTNGLFPKTVDWLQTNFVSLQRAALIKLYPFKDVALHVDRGDYFDKTKRFHLCLKGSYRYFVGEESLDVVPGMLFTFRNDVRHGTQNLNREDRITLMFDVLKPL